MQVWSGARSVNGNNDLSLSNSDFNIPNRIVGLLGYKFEYGGEYGGTTSFSIGYVGSQNGAYSYTISGDMNGDRVNNNELIYVPKKIKKIKSFQIIDGSFVFIL